MPLTKVLQVPLIHRRPGLRLPRSGLKVLVYLRDIEHDALPVRPVGPHQLFHVLRETQQQFRSHRQRLSDPWGGAQRRGGYNHVWHVMVKV